MMSSSFPPEGATPSYCPAGWDLERLLNVGVTGDAASVTPKQWEVFREGFKADKGEQAFEGFSDEMWRREKKAKGIETPIGEPQFMELMRIREQRVGPSAQWDPWGFIIFKSPQIQNDREWQACKERFAAIIEDVIQRDRCREFPGAEECLSRMQFRWVEDAGDQEGGFRSIARARANLELPAGQNHSISLYITPSSLSSILNSPLPSSAKRKWRKQIPFVVAVSAKAGEEIDDVAVAEDVAGADWRGYFNIAVESLVYSVFSMLADDSRSPFEMGGRVEGEDIWCDPYRGGIHRAET
ncbi:hypothetical protein F5Y16DRAFT_359007 [Xylariaceae sp. FL0255]|nr:hypothetical protein F5Y16DRAFT_359007 [Xylariaceae sp. FL0255]